MSPELPGIHHVTAVTGSAPANVDFYTRVLGLRLVKKTVNQDDLTAYHLFYGDRVGSPGTELTFFDWPQSPPAIGGAATIAPVALTVVDESALSWWADRFDSFGVAHGLARSEAGLSRLEFQDPEGQRLELVADDPAPGGVPWRAPGVPLEVSLRGFHDVTVTSARPEATELLLTEVMGFKALWSSPPGSGAGRVVIYGTAGGGAGSRVRLAWPTPGQLGSVGIGGVHHVAFRAIDDDAQSAWRDRLLAAGLRVTPIIDRYYFRSIYFREPGGALFEIATDGPGFTGDESEDELGRRLSLPPFLESRRAEIEGGLRPIEGTSSAPWH
ncbi:MAG TPA: ring-cleaving dioxygenase [Candidatus Nitrosotalea sp.]|nr:ring-cleaving dioxygenase [Candidatus Nitrosotalea sp.]